MNVALKSLKATVAIKLEIVKQIEWMFAIGRFYKRTIDFLNNFQDI